MNASLLVVAGAGRSAGWSEYKARCIHKWAGDYVKNRVTPQS